MIAYMKRALCRILMALVTWTPFGFAQAGMIGTDQVVSSTSQADRGAVLNFLSRADVVSQLQAFGLNHATAKDRVAAMTDEEIRYLAGQIDSLPAGGISHGAKVLIVLVIVGAVIWWATTSR